MSWPSNKGGVDQFLSPKAKSDVGATSARVLRKADSAMRQKMSRFDLPDRVFNQPGEFLSLLVRDGCTQILNFDHPFTDKNNLSNIRDAGSPRVADKLWVEG
jgi:hypothetical protein